MVLLTISILFVSLTSYLLINHTRSVKETGEYLKNTDTSRIMLSLRNLLIDEAIALGGLRPPDPGYSLPLYLIEQNYNPPVTDVWGSEIKYCVYNSADEPVSGLAGRLISAGENKNLQTACWDESAKGDDIVLNILAQQINSDVIRNELSWPPPVMISINNDSSYLVREDGSFWAWGKNANRSLQDGTLLNRRLPVAPRRSDDPADVIAEVARVSAGTSDGFLFSKIDSSLWAATSNEYPLQIPLNNVVKFAAAGFGSSGEPTNGLALKDDGTIWSWGRNPPARRFLKAGVINSTIAVSASRTLLNGHALALKGDGSVWAWGRNDYGQLGDGTTANSVVPLQVSAAADVYTAISAGGYHSLALKADGTVWAWGLNDYGQLGDGTTVSRPAPVQVIGLTGVTAVSAGENHSLALMPGGSVMAWGLNSNGQLGNGTTDQSTTPVFVSGLSGVTAISAGGSHSLALNSDQTVAAWGLNDNGQLGDGSTNQRLTPLVLPLLDSITEISAGTAHSMAIKAGPPATLWGWGLNSFGRLGDGTETTGLSPAEITGVTDVKAISAGAEHTLAVKTDGTLWAWGRNDLNNELGDKTSDNSFLPLQVANLSSISGISAGGGNSFAITADSTLWTWGNGWPSIFLPAQVWDAAGTGTLAGIADISTSLNHSLALAADGTVWAWGSNGSGQLGNGTGLGSIYPVQVSTLGAGVTAISAGENHSLALKNDGTVRAWGLNSGGQLGINSDIDAFVPVQVIGPGNSGFLSNVEGVSAGKSHSLARYADGTVWAWGNNSSGQLGDGTTISQSTPVKVLDISAATTISAGGNHSAALSASDLIWTWGLNISGQLGNGGWVDKTSPDNVIFVRYIVQ